MKKILIVDDNLTILKTINLGLNLLFGSRYELLFAENGAEAIEILKDGQIAIVVTDLYMPEVDGFELLAHMSRHHPETPCIVMTAFSAPELSKHFSENGVFRFLEKPFELEVLAKAITDAVTMAEQGKPLELLSPLDFIKLLEFDHKSCTIEVQNSDGRIGLLNVVDGLLHDAKAGELQGEEAAIDILGWEKSSFNITDIGREDIAIKIISTLDQLAAKAETLRNTAGSKPRGTALPATHNELLFLAIRNAENGNIKQAQALLTKILKEAPQNSMAWLWLARISDNFKTVRIALKNASLTAPDDPEVIKELAKLTGAVSDGCEDTEHVDHCVFCWAPVRKKSTVCHHCNAQLDINEAMFHASFFDSRKPPELKEILDSFQRFTKATIVDQHNAGAHYRLALTHINLEQWDEALGELKQATTIEPANAEYLAKYTILAEFLADLGGFFDEDQEKHPSAAPEEAKPRRKVKILVVEDSATTRTVISRMLTNEGYEVIQAMDGIEAITRFAETKPDLVLLDIIMPGIDGYETLAILKKNHDLSDIPVIMLTAKDSLVAKLKGKMSGSTEYLTKPFNALELMAKIKKHLTH